MLNKCLKIYVCCHLEDVTDAITDELGTTCVTTVYRPCLLTTVFVGLQATLNFQDGCIKF